MIKAILALDQNNLLGDNNKLPWHYKEDLLYFNQMTNNKKVLVGHNTYISLINYYHVKPKFSHIYLLSNDSSLNSTNITIINNLDNFLNDYPKDEELFIIGGKMVYELALKYTDLIYLTRINEVHKGNIYLELKSDQFREIARDDRKELSFITYERIK